MDQNIAAVIVVESNSRARERESEPAPKDMTDKSSKVLGQRMKLHMIRSLNFISALMGFAVFYLQVF